MSRSRKYCFTINNPTPADIENVKNLEAVYVVCGSEVGEQGTPHLQGFVYFSTMKSLKQVSKLLPRAHLEEAKGSIDANREYCIKEGDFFEIGTPPLNQKRKGEVETERWADAKRKASEGDLDNIPDDIYIRYYRTLKEIKKDHMPKVEDADDTTGIWYWGDAGAGKSRKAREEFPNAYFKMCNKWWDGYQQEPHVIIDDVDPNHKVLGHHLKIWGDRYAFLAETKGGAIMIRPAKIIVTSQYPIAGIFPDAETQQAIHRRYKEEEIIKPSENVE